MTSVLNQIEIDNYHRDGFLSPLRVLSSNKVENYLKKYRAFYLRHNTNFDAKSVLRSTPHLVFPGLAILATSGRPWRREGELHQDTGAAHAHRRRNSVTVACGRTREKELVRVSRASCVEWSDARESVFMVCGRHPRRVLKLR